MNIWTDFPKIPLPQLLSFVVDNRGKSVPLSDGGNHVLIATNCIRNENLYPSYEKIRWLSQDTYDNWFRAHPVPGDILFVCKGTPGRVCMVPDPIDFCIAQDMVALRTDDTKVYNRYLLAILRSRPIQKQITNTSVGDVIPHFKKQFFDQLLIPIPPLEVQRKIGDIYFDFSLKIEKNKQINDNLLQQAMTLYQSWFVTFDSTEGKPCANWEKYVIDDLTSLVSRGITPKYDDRNNQIVINQKCIRGHMIDLTPARHHNPKGINEKWLQHGDLLINSTGEGTLGRVAQVWFFPTNMTVDSHVTIVRPSRTDLKYYIGFWGITHEREIEALHVGSTGQTELPRDRIKTMSIILPDSGTLHRFNEVIEPITTMIVSNQMENKQLASLRDELLPRLMSGELDVSDLDI